MRKKEEKKDQIFLIECSLINFRRIFREGYCSKKEFGGWMEEIKVDLWCCCLKLALINYFLASILFESNFFILNYCFNQLNIKNL